MKRALTQSEKACKMRAALRQEAETLSKTPIEPYEGAHVVKTIETLVAAAQRLTDEGAARLHDIIMSGDR